MLLKSIESAIDQALTWGDFERLCPAIEFEALGLWQSNEGENVYRRRDDPVIDLMHTGSRNFSH